VTSALLITVVASVVCAIVLAALAALRWWAARGLEGVMDELEDGRPLLPEGHRPPPGLGPISPSARAVTAEVERGLRDLQLFLLDAA
jgi:hypothetical protein